MRAAVCPRYGPPDVVEVEEVARAEPADDEVLVRADVATVEIADARVRALRVPRGFGPLVRLQFGVTKPRQPILGLVVAGRVEAVGGAVTGVRPGDLVVGTRGFSYGCHAEYVAVPEGNIAAIPDELTERDAAALCFGGATAVHFLRKGRLAAGEHILVNGASGSVGTMAVQIAKDIGAEVTAVCSGGNADLVRRLGADHVVDHTREDFQRDGRRYDVIMDNHGNATYRRVRGSLAPDGRVLMVVGGLGSMVAGAVQKRVVGGSAPLNGDVFREVVDLGRRRVLEPVVDTVLPLDEIVAAHRRVDSGHKVGSVVLTFDDSR